MSVGPMGMIGSAAGSPLAQGQGADVNKAQQDSTDHAHRHASTKRPSKLRESDRRSRTKRRRIVMPTVAAPGRSDRKIPAISRLSKVLRTNRFPRVETRQARGAGSWISLAE